MLKIKDNVDLKELEKFRFKKQKDAYIHKREKYDIRKVDIEDRDLSHYTECYDEWSFCDNDELLEVVFDDLIQAGLVEKIDD